MWDMATLFILHFLFEFYWKVNSLRQATICGCHVQVEYLSMSQQDVPSQCVGMQSSLLAYGFVVGVRNSG